MCEQRGHVRLAQADDIGEEDPAVFVQNLPRIEDDLFLVLQLLESSWDVNVLQFCRAIQLVAEILIEELQIKLVGREAGVTPVSMFGLSADLSSSPRTSSATCSFASAWE